MGGCEVRLTNQFDIEDFSYQLLKANIELPENLVIHLSIDENKQLVSEFEGINNSNKDIKINTIQTQFHRFKIQVD